MKPRSSGGAAGWTMGMVYSTAMKRRSPHPKSAGSGCRRSTAATAAAEHQSGLLHPAPIFLLPASAPLASGSGWTPPHLAPPRTANPFEISASPHPISPPDLRPPTRMPPPSRTAQPDRPPTSVVTSRRRGGGKAESEAKVHPLPEANGAEAGRRKMGAGWRRPDWCSAAAVAAVLRRHPLPALFGCGLLLFMAVEYTIPMVQPAAPPLDLGFIATKGMYAAVAARPWLNSLLAALNTVFVAMQAAYILWAILGEGRPRAAVAALMMFTCRGVLGCATQLPLPREFLGSGMDFPVGNVSFFLFFSGHVAGAVIAAADMRREGRIALARLYDALNVLQGVRLLACRGHYTIDLAVGVGAGVLFDTLSGWYFDGKNAIDDGYAPERHCRSCQCHRAVASY